MTVGCTVLKTNSMTQCEMTTDHISLNTAPSLRNNTCDCDEDEAVVKAMKVVHWLAEKDMPLSKYVRTSKYKILPYYLKKVSVMWQDHEEEASYRSCNLI